MDDLISRQAAIDTVNFHQDTYGDDPAGWIEHAIKELPSVQQEQNVESWIPCSERLPVPNRLVLCYIKTGVTETYFLAFWNDFKSDWEEGIGGCRLLEHDLGYEVIAWMPLPQTYQPKEGDE